MKNCAMHAFYAVESVQNKGGLASLIYFRLAVIKRRLALAC